MFDLLCRNPKYRENLNHYPYDNIHHLRGRRHLCVHLETSEKHFDSFEDVHNSVLTCLNVLSCLRDVCVTMCAELLRIRTERRTPIPVKITLAGENACQVIMSVQISDNRMSLGLPGRHPLQPSQKKQTGRSPLDQATLSIDHQLVTDLTPGLVAEGWREWH